MLITVLRTIILYLLVVISLRLMGKQQIGELQPFEFVVTLMIAELATIPMEDTGSPLLRGIIPILILFASQTTLSYMSLKDQKFRKLLNGAPTIIVKNGKIQEKELAQARYNVNDLLEQLRLKNYPNVNEIEFAILETNGQLSVIPKGEHEKIKLKDLNLPSSPLQYPLTLIVDGVIQHKNLKEANWDYKKLQENLQVFNIKDSKNALIAMLDTTGSFYAQSKNKDTSRLGVEKGCE